MLTSLLNKIAGREPCNFVKKRLQQMCFPVNIANFLRTPILKSICVRVRLNDFRKSLFRTVFLDSRFQNHPDSAILHKCQSLSNQSFKHNSAHISSLNLTSTLSFEPRFRMFIINDYDRKNKRMQSLDSLFLNLRSFRETDVVRFTVPKFSRPKISTITLK